MLPAPSSLIAVLGYEIEAPLRRRCVAVTDAGFAAAARGLPEIRVLRLYACAAVTAAVLEFGRLRHLRVRSRGAAASEPWRSRLAARVWALVGNRAEREAHCPAPGGAGSRCRHLAGVPLALSPFLCVKYPSS